MAYSSIKEFSKHEQHTSIVCQALSHPARLRMVTRIAKTEEKMLDFYGIANDMPLSHPTIKQHIDYLRKRKVLVLGKNGASYVYRLNTNMPLLMNCIQSIIAENDHTSKSDIENEVDSMGSALL